MYGGPLRQSRDGRHRFLACVEVGIGVTVREYSGADAFKFVVDQNINRRHLTTSQRAMIAAEMVTFRNGGDRRSDQSANWQTEISAEKAADALSVGLRSVGRAKVVAESGNTDLIKDVKAGKVSLNKAVNTLKGAEKSEALLKSGAHFVDFVEIFAKA